MNDKHAPIGVFDSGIGGLTVLRALSSRLQNESFIYLGDLARVPYGTKSESTVRRFAMECATFLFTRGVKAIVVACNTATALALDEIRRAFSLPVFGVIDAGVRTGLEVSRRRRILVLGTAATIRSGAYRQALAQEDPQAQIEELACPLLVSLAEEGWFDHEVTKQVIRAYLDRATQPFDTVLLGCTHYPLLMPSFLSVVGEEIALVHGAALLAHDVEASLGDLNLLSDLRPVEAMRFLSTDSVESDCLFVEKLFGRRIAFTRVSLNVREAWAEETMESIPRISADQNPLVAGPNTTELTELRDY